MSALNPPPATPALAADDLNNAIVVLVARLDEQFRIAERVESKGRQVFAVCAAFYAGAQAVAFTSFAESDVHTNERVLLLVSALLATGLLVRVAQLLIVNERPREERSFSAEGVVEWFKDGADGYVSRQLALNLAEVAGGREETNRDRVAGYRVVLEATRWALALAALEAIVAIVVRI